MNQAAIKDMATIVVKLTITCLAAGLIMGGTFVLTHDAKAHNEQVRDERVMYSILGYDKSNPVPETMALNSVYRYVLTRGETQSIGYVLPERSGAYVLVELDLEGHFVKKTALALDAAKLRNAGERDAATAAAAACEARYADSFIVATDHGQRTAYILDGKYPGFKAMIRVKMALDAQFTMLGFEVLEHEEDPGLGAEIEQTWFRGQFEGKSFEQLKKAGVVRTPMPEALRDAIEGKVAADEAQKVRGEHLDDDIYALTGATISSRSVLNGNQAIVKKFVTRLDTLDKALASQNITPAF